MGEEVAERIMTAFPPVEHPLVRTPSGHRPARPVPVRRFMDQIVGMHRDESDALLGYLSRHIEDPNFCVRWHWTEGDVAVWDEASTNHRALLRSLSRAPRHATVHRRRHGPSFTS